MTTRSFPMNASDWIKHDPSWLTPLAKVELKKRGYTYRSAAPLVGRTYPWICEVLNGRKTSQPVLDAIFSLPLREKRKAAKSISRGSETRNTISQQKAATLLGVSREHLNRVLNGRRSSRSLLRRFAKLQGQS